MTESIQRNIATESRLLKRSCESLIGICGGLIADGELNDREIIFLSTWLSENESMSQTWPGEVVFARVREVLADGIRRVVRGENEPDHRVGSRNYGNGGRLLDLGLGVLQPERHHEAAGIVGVECGL